MVNENSDLHPLMMTHRQNGRVAWIGIRSERKWPPEVATEVVAVQDEGLKGDHYSNRGGRRQVTLIQGEHLDAVASILGVESIDPLLTRRNIVVRGINLAALKDRAFSIGEAVLEYTGECHPCSRMEANLGPGGYNAMRGHGGILARVLQSGTIHVGASVNVVAMNEEAD